MSLDYSTPHYPLRQAAAAAGFEVNTLRSLYQRGHFKVIGGQAAKSRGLANALNLHDIMNIAVAKALMDVGVHPAAAFEAGVRFAHSSSGVRLPGQLFDEREHGFTVLIYHPGGSTKIVSTHDGLDFGQLFFDATTGGRRNAAVILLNDVEREVFSKLPRIVASVAEVEREAVIA